MLMSLTLKWFSNINCVFMFMCECMYLVRRGRCCKFGKKLTIYEASQEGDEFILLFLHLQIKFSILNIFHII